MPTCASQGCPDPARGPSESVDVRDRLRERFGSLLRVAGDAEHPDLLVALRGRRQGAVSQLAAFRGLTLGLFIGVWCRPAPATQSAALVPRPVPWTTSLQPSTLQTCLHRHVDQDGGPGQTPAPHSG